MTALPGAGGGRSNCCSRRAEVDERWCLIHATHMTQAETVRLARSGAVAGLCPITEANLGDGIFPADAFVRCRRALRRRLRFQCADRRGGRTAHAGIFPAPGAPRPQCDGDGGGALDRHRLVRRGACRRRAGARCPGRHRRGQPRRSWSASMPSWSARMPPRSIAGSSPPPRPAIDCVWRRGGTPRRARRPPRPRPRHLALRQAAGRSGGVNAAPASHAKRDLTQTIA